MSVTDINTRVSAAVAAIDSGDYATALVKLLGAKALLAAMPDTKHGEVELEWDREAIDSLITSVRTAQIGASNSSGLRRTNVTYVNPTSTDTW